LPEFVASDFIPKSQPELTIPRSCEPEKEQRNSVANRLRGMYLVDGRGSIALENAKVDGELALITFNPV
jgi:hypothetical protein